MIPFIDATEVARLLSFELLIEHMRQQHRQPPAQVERSLLRQSATSGGENAFLIWPAWQAGQHLGIKVVTVFPDNQELPTVHAIVLLFDGENGKPLAIIDGTELTYWKTAADSALGADHLARRDARTLLMVGAGRLAPFLIRAHLCVRPGIDRLLLWNRTPERAVNLAELLGDGIRCEVVSDLAGAVANADIVCCATRSQNPLIQGDWLQPGTHVDLVGGFTPQMREADDQTLRRASIHVDSRWFTLEHVGDLCQPIAGGVIGPHDIRGDLFELCSGRSPGRRDAGEITLFKSGGGAHLDLMTSQLVFACSQSRP